MKQPYRHRVNQREFLNLPGFHECAYVMAYVEDTSERRLESYDGSRYNPHPRMLLQIADCDSHISLDFDISSPHRRMNSFHKIQTDRRAGGVQGGHGRGVHPLQAPRTRARRALGLLISAGGLSFRG